jgi:hypothetical protein
MLTFAFDAAGDESTEYMTVAGFASSANDWDRFSAQWQSRLDSDDIQFFRAVDANNFRGPFQHWYDRPDREQLRRALFSDLMELIKRHAYRKFGCTIVNKDFKESNDELRQQFADSAYSVAARTCEKYARHWALAEWSMCPTMQLATIFEAGDPGQTRLQERLRKDYGHIPPNFRPKKTTPRKDEGVEYGFVPLQAADWLAWELNRAARDFYPDKLSSESQLRWPLREFLGRPDGYLGIYTPDNLDAMHNMLKLESEIDSWVTALGLAKAEDSGRYSPHEANAKGQAAR